MNPIVFEERPRFVDANFQPLSNYGLCADPQECGYIMRDLVCRVKGCALCSHCIAARVDRDYDGIVKSGLFFQTHMDSGPVETLHDPASRPGGIVVEENQ